MLRKIKNRKHYVNTRERYYHSKYRSNYFDSPLEDWAKMLQKHLSNSSFCTQKNVKLLTYRKCSPINSWFTTSPDCFLRTSSENLLRSLVWILLEYMMLLLLVYFVNKYFFFKFYIKKKHPFSIYKCEFLLCNKLNYDRKNF